MTLWPPCWSWSLTSLLIMRPRPPQLSPRSRRKQVLVIQWSVQPWRGPLLQSHGRLAQGLMRPCELYFLTSYSCPEAHESFTQDRENVWKCMAVTDKDVALFSFFILHILYGKRIFQSWGQVIFGWQVDYPQAAALPLKHFLGILQKWETIILSWDVYTHIKLWDIELHTFCFKKKTT